MTPIKRIAQMIDLLRVGGAQKLVITMAAEAQANSVELTVICLHYDEGVPPVEELQSLGARVLIFPASNLFAPGRLWRITRFLRSQSFDVLHTHLAYANIIGAITGRLAGLPVIATLHTTGSGGKSRRPVLDFCEDLSIRFAAKRVIAVGPRVAEAYSSRLAGRHIDVIPNAVLPGVVLSPEDRVALRKELTIDPYAPVLISVGRLDKPKGMGDLINAFASVHHTYPKTKLLIAGEGPLFDDLKAQIARLNLENAVFMLGRRTDIPQLLAISDLYATATHWEGLPIAILEAMMAGLPIVSTDVGDIPRAVVAGTGLLVPPHQPQPLIEAICSLLAEPEQLQSMGARARSHALAHYSASAWFDQMMALYESCTRSGHLRTSRQGASR